MADTSRLEAEAPADSDVRAEGVPFRAAVPAADACGGWVKWPCGWLSACRVEGRALVADACPLAHPASVAQIPAAAVSMRKAVPSARIVFILRGRCGGPSRRDIAADAVAAGSGGLVGRCHDTAVAVYPPVAVDDVRAGVPGGEAGDDGDMVGIGSRRVQAVDHCVSRLRGVTRARRVPGSVGHTPLVEAGRCAVDVTGAETVGEGDTAHTPCPGGEVRAPLLGEIPVPAVRAGVPVSAELVAVSARRVVLISDLTLRVGDDLCAKRLG